MANPETSSNNSFDRNNYVKKIGKVGPLPVFYTTPDILEGISDAAWAESDKETICVLGNTAETHQVVKGQVVESYGANPCIMAAIYTNSGKLYFIHRVIPDENIILAAATGICGSGSKTSINDVRATMQSHNIQLIPPPRKDETVDFAMIIVNRKIEGADYKKGIYVAYTEFEDDELVFPYDS